MKSVKEILAHKPSYFNVVSSDDTVIDALRVMQRENLNYAIVMDNDRYIGVMGEHDYSTKVILEGRHSDKAKVKDIMSCDYPIISEDDNTDECLMLMYVSNKSFLPVFNRMEFKGIITVNDIMRENLSEKKELLQTSTISHAFVY